jgi:hypothetical protein
MTGIDLKLDLDLGHIDLADSKGVAHEFGKTDIFPDNGFSAPEAVSKMR